MYIFAPTSFVETRYWDNSNWITAAQVVDGNLIVSGTIIADKIAVNSITTEKISSNSITAEKITEAAVGTNTLVTNAVSSTVTANNTVTETISGSSIRTLNSGNAAVNVVPGTIIQVVAAGETFNNLYRIIVYVAPTSGITGEWIVEPPGLGGIDWGASGYNSLVQGYYKINSGTGIVNMSADIQYYGGADPDFNMTTKIRIIGLAFKR
jgi:hypothetical protein